MRVRWGMRGRKPRSPAFTFRTLILHAVFHVLGTSSRTSLDTRTFKYVSAGGENPSQDSKVKLDGFLESIVEVGSHNMVETASTKTGNSSSSISPERRRGNWDVEDDPALVTTAVVREALNDAAMSAIDQMEEEIATAREGSDDWLEAADATCGAIVSQRRLEVLELYHHGRMEGRGLDCSRLTELLPTGMQNLCDPPATDMVSSRQADPERRCLVDSGSSLVACRAFFEMSEMEYARAACLRALRLGEVEMSEVKEIYARLAAIAERYGRPSVAAKLYFSMMASPATNDDGRLAMSILGLTMIPPTLIGGPLRAIAEFRAAWVRDLRKLRRNLVTGTTSGGLTDPVQEVGRTPFHLAHQGGPELEMMTALAGVYDVAAPSLRYVAPHCGGGMEEEGREAANRSVSERPIRLGFFSVYLRNHSVGKMMARLIVLLAEKPGLEVHVFVRGGGSGGGSGSKAGGEEEMKKRGGDSVEEALRSRVHFWHQVPARDLHAARMAVAQEQLDVLVYPDIGMDSLTYFMSFARLAPVQCVWWGHPVTPSTGAIDYFLSLDVEIEEGHYDYLEQMVRMDFLNTAHFKQMDVWAHNHGLPQESPSTRNGDGGSTWSPAPAQSENLSVIPAPRAINPASLPNAAGVSGKALSRAGAGAVEVSRGLDSVSGEAWHKPSCARNYLVLARLFKIHPDFDAAIAGVLAGDAGGCVVLIHETRDEEWTRGVWARLRELLVPRDEYRRLRIMHHWLYPRALHRATAVLDTFPYGGCLTVLEALSNGVPVVTLPAQFIRGRFALAIYTQMGYTDLVADDIAEYVSTAVRLGVDEVFRKEAVNRVQEAYSVSLHKHQQSAHEWAAFIVRAHRAGRTTN